MGKRKSNIIRPVEQPIAPPEPLKLDLGCGPRKQPGFHGVDAIPFVGVDTVLDLAARDWSFLDTCADWRDGIRKASEPPTFVRWPWADASVSEVFSSHFLEHLAPEARVHFFNELYRILTPGGRALIVTPHYSNACAYGDPTHKWMPISEWFPLYLNAQWRAVNAPHSGYTCDFDPPGAGTVVGFGFDDRVATWNPERQGFAMNHHLNGVRDMHLTLTKRG